MNPDDELMVLFWEKPEVFWNDELELTNEGWARVVKEFEEWEGSDRDICNWLADAIIDHSEVVIDPNNG
ncbi:MAG: hypothetical protein EBY83_07545 [Verrucomicrobia bacterium]|jgi:hypothetical protein|nr:hypothetical protein [Verrucomicrobiota bacterium]